MPTSPHLPDRAPDLDEVAETARLIAPHTVETPTIPWAERLLRDTEVLLKLELFQLTGSFKARGAVANALKASPEERSRGFTAFSSGNHAAAVAYAAKVVGTSAKVVMLRSANPARVENCRRYGAEILFAENGSAAAAQVDEIVRNEGRTFIHPYEGFWTSAGAGTLALEIERQVPDLDAVVVAIGGGGLCSGVAATLKQLRPQCQVLAVEPTGADTMRRSFASGRPETLDAVDTIADTLAPPNTLPYSLGLCRRYVDELALVSDDEMRDAMALLYSRFKLAVEAGGAAALAGALGPFRSRLAGKKAVVIVCGSNIDLPTYSRHVMAAPALEGVISGTGMGAR
jgi:threonine dehydratase